ncbi:Prolyl tripeptidyl peptidase precursor [Phycisphaerae bacterium RAS1]|nr:Prolyl tripeptidyl peptidase precursor [Phycisphaerae bacterium RAS1]
MTLAGLRKLIPTLAIGACAFSATADDKPDKAGAKTAAKAGEPAVKTDAKAGDLIPRAVIFGNPDRAQPQVSRDGKQLSFLSAVNGVLNVWVGPVNQPDAAKPVTSDTKRGIRQYMWAYDNQHIIYLQDTGGDENWRVYGVNVAKGETRDLTPFEKVAARIEGVSEKFPGEILIGLNKDNPQLHDLYRVNLATGEMKQVIKNTGFIGYEVDADWRVRFATRFSPDGGMEIFKPGEKEGDWVSSEKIPAEDTLTTRIETFDTTGENYYATDSRGRNTAGLFIVNAKSGEKKLLAEDARSDAGAAVQHPSTRVVQAVSFNYDRERWQILDKSIEPDFAYLKTACDGDFGIGSRSLDDKTWIVTYKLDNGPVKYFRYDRDARKATYLFSNFKALEGQKLARMHPVVIKSRDGMDLVSYLTLPPSADAEQKGRPSQPVPMVLFVHGGPWGRDEWGYNPYHQWLSNRGYAVLSVNFRASTGLGKNFANAGDFQWGRKMHDDLLDAVEWAKKEKIADPARVAIMGGSYGGYATLWGVTNTPDVFACGVDIVGPSNLLTLLNSIPPYWAPMLEMFAKRVGDPRTEQGKALLNERSPLTYVDQIKKPLLIGQGANDPRVKQTEADQIVSAMQAKKIPVTYVLYPDEGHGFARPENRMSFNAVTEAFLARHLGGRFEPIGADFKGSSIKVPAGADGVQGLAEALRTE